MERSHVCARGVGGAGLAALLLVAAVVACGGEVSAPSAPAATAPTPSARPSEPPSPAPPPTVPTGNLRGNPELGGRLYAMYCATCHGPEGRGDGPIAQTLVPRPADHGSAEYMRTLSDEEIYLVIEKGGAAAGKSSMMAPWGGILNDSDIRDVIAHLRSLSGT